MPHQPAIDRAIDDIADGAPIDWDALDSQAPDDERELLKCLRILGDIADLHRSTVDDDAAGRGLRPLPTVRAAEGSRTTSPSRGAAIV